MKEKIFIGSNINELMDDRNCDFLEGNEKTSWEAFGLVVDNIPGSQKAANCR
jgi:hypothetical protein